ncbi:hypothetical protein LNTAR_19332 [Lentisphaera araneosa HTCC2155]|uniref:YcxB-like protein domain-containing protein n=1 Tax=Lentisphaera araneosa HTCC2155 TaxID=313628 RepID=A6DQT2_9BACT|nr:hypothetical protein [Lentisphaera araneosa]EDM25982.1 hypothetical protein LNTAR_19332 [Lentisphaera araneosa HTCC2155]
MKLNFKSTIEQGVDCQIRQLKINNVYDKNKKTSILVKSSFLFLLMFSMNITLGYHTMIYSILITIIYSLYSFYTYDKNTIKNLYKFGLDSRGTDSPLDAEYEITEKFLIYKFCNDESHFSWKNLETVKMHASDIQVDFGHSGMALLHNEIFPDDETKEIWFKLLKTKEKKT